MKKKDLRNYSLIARPATLTALALLILLLPLLSATAQTFQVIHNFTNGGDGGTPPYTLAKDAFGHFYGTASMGGQNGDGVVFKMTQMNSRWVLTPLYNFTDQDGQPGWGVTVASDGTIYTSASYVSIFGGSCGNVLRLQPPPTRPASILTPWNGTSLHTYVQNQDGCPTGNLVLDTAGHVYGVTQNGGAHGGGSVFELMHTSSGWTETILYSFQGGDDGAAPYSGLVLDNAGNLYGTATARGAFNHGVVFKLTNTGSGWTESVLYAFQGGNDGGQPVAGLIFDNAGNLYGAAESFGSGGGGTVFELSPSGGGWNYAVLASLTGTAGPVAALTFDASGNLYGTTFRDDPAGYGSVFELTPSGGSWTYTDLHDFTGGADGGYPGGGVTLDAAGNLYGTAVEGGANNFGVVWEITP